MYVSWRNIFVKAGYTREEMYEASEFVAAHSTARFLGDQLNELVNRLNDQRRIAHERLREKWEEQHGTCDRCGNSGLVIVPHSRCMDQGTWEPVQGVRYEMVVRCVCWNGRQNGLKCRTLADYQMQFPHWQEEMLRVKDMGRAMDKVRTETRGRGLSDLPVEQFLKRISSRGKPEETERDVRVVPRLQGPPDLPVRPEA